MERIKLSLLTPVSVLVQVPFVHARRGQAPVVLHERCVLQFQVLVEFLHAWRTWVNRKFSCTTQEYVDQEPARGGVREGENLCISDANYFVYILSYVLRLDLFSYNKIDKFLKTVVKK
jgi:hypothetical protein